MTTNLLYATITAYCACKLCCGPRATGLCADGRVPLPNHTVAGPRSLRLHSRIKIGGTVYTLEDRTSRRFDGRFDIFMSSHRDAINFGIRRERITIITP